jgi:hypothetical protein
VAARLAGEPGLKVSRVKGRIGELRVAVDGADVVDTNMLWYPTPSSVVKRVLSHLRTAGG